MRRQHGQWRLQASQLLVDGVTASGTERSAWIGGQHMLDETAMCVAEIMRWLAECQAAAPGTEHMTSFRRRSQGLLTVLFQLTLLFFGRKQRHTDRHQPAHLRAELVRHLNGLDGTCMYAQQVDGALHAGSLQPV